LGLYSTRIVTSDHEFKPKGQRRGKGRQGTKNPKIILESADENNNKFKHSTMSTSSVIESEDSEWCSPFEEVKLTPTKLKSVKKHVCEPEKPKGVKRKAKEERKKHRVIQSIRQKHEFSRMIITEANI
jgi:hypothetical protein